MLAPPALPQVASDGVASDGVAGDRVASDETAGERFENVHVLDQMPATQMGKVMNIMSASLGVSCTYCHSGTDFAAEGVALKDRARDMIEMTLAINKSHFSSSSRVTCNTCHRGKSKPVSTLVLNHAPPSQAESESSIAKIEEALTATEILNRYFDALGGREKLGSLRTLHVTGTRLEPSGKTEPEELWQTSNGQSRMKTLYGTLAVIEGFDGKLAWKQAGDSFIQLKPDELEQLTTENSIAFGVNIIDAYSEFISAGVQQIDGSQEIDDVQVQRRVRVVRAMRLSGMEEHLFFDVGSGLLVRRVASLETMLGPYQYQVDYAAYKNFDGLLAPTRIRFAVPSITWTRVVNSIEFNVSMKDTFFQKPKAGR